MEIRKGTSSAGWQIVVQKLAAIKVFTRILSRGLHVLDRQAFEHSGGQLTLTSVLTELPVILLTATGARSKKARSVPLFALLDGPNIILAATNWGKKKHPGWYYNLKSNPRATVHLGNREIHVEAREASVEEKQRLWHHFVAMYAGYEAYRLRVSQRTIPLLILRPIILETDNESDAAGETSKPVSRSPKNTFRS